MSRSLGFTGIFGSGISVLATILSISAPANALNFTTFTDRGLWEAEVGGSFSEETFNSYNVDTSFNNTNVDVGDFTLNGTTAFGGVQIIDVQPLATPSADIDSPIIRVAANSVSSFTATFDSPITAFGATFNGVSDNSAVTQLTAGSDVVGNVPEITLGNTGFFGFVADGSFSLLTVDSANDVNDVFAMDNFVYASSSTPVPFEVSPTLGLLTVGGIWLLSRLRQKRGVNKITK